MSDPLISIAMPFFNAEHTMRASIRSILAQSYSNWELLLCDDGSTDSGRDLACSFRDPRIVVWSDRRRRQLGARLNECIDAARGEYLARMDADDVAYPQRLEQQLRFLIDHPEIDLTGGWAVIFGDGGVPIGRRADPVAHADIARRPLYSFPLMHPTFMGKTAWFRRHRYSAEAIRCEDHDLLFRTHTFSRFANLPEIVLGYREGSINLSKRLRSRWTWCRHVSCYLERPALVRLAAVEALKGCRDILAVAARADTAWLHLRWAPLTDTELLEWREVWRSVS